MGWYLNFLIGRERITKHPKRLFTYVLEANGSRGGYCRQDTWLKISTKMRHAKIKPGAAEDLKEVFNLSRN